MHEYFYGAQSSTYSFIRVPTVLFTDDQYKYVSAEAKILYGLLLARMDLCQQKTVGSMIRAGCTSFVPCQRSWRS